MEKFQDIVFSTTPKQFRVWDTLHHRWFQGATDGNSLKYMTDHISYFGEVLIMQGTLWDKNSDRAWQDDVNSSLEIPQHLIVVQSIGIMDRDNRPIFEGDILDFWGDRVYVSYDALFGDYVQLSKANQNCRTTYAWSQGKIIGNIFENMEELL